MSNGVIPMITSPLARARGTRRTRGPHQAPGNNYISKHTSVQNIAVVQQVIPETDKAVTLVFSTHRPISFQAGQYAACNFTISGNVVERCYSFSGLRRDGLYQITVKETPGGLVSHYINQSLQAGDSFQIARIDGNITPDIIANNHQPLVLFAGGSGITPLKTLAESVLKHSSSQPVTLVYSNRSRSDTVFLAALTELEKSHDNFRFLNLLDQTDSRSDLQGPVDLDILNQHGLLNENSLFVICGPGGYVEHIFQLLKGADVNPGQIHLELFSRAGGNAKKDSDPNNEVFNIDIQNTGKRYQCRGSNTLLDSASNVGLPLDHSCQMGGCGHCKVKLISGEVNLPEPNCLTDQEKAKGYILTCIGQPKSDLVITTEV